ncbi:hypothetical protein I5M34_24565 [Pseudomonas aeruginosa]|nr:hypothetical protein [Pseudomonas aeruginosa]MBX6012954.1 hypothetical protein [Pseudomonas aeruginosa]HDX6332701.1 hypothetical protein [Pseudomonas aeruginosa]
MYILVVVKFSKKVKSTQPVGGDTTGLGKKIVLGVVKALTVSALLDLAKKVIAFISEIAG